MPRLLALLALVGFAATANAQDEFKPLFNGKNLAGWHNVNCAPSTWFVKEGMIITTGKPTGYLRTDKQYENFILEFEWFHAPAKKGAVGNSGLFVWGDPIPAKGTGYTRSIEVQVLVNLDVKDTYTSQGDLFSIWGAKCKPDRPHPKGWERCLPSENRCKGEYEWNHYKVIANDGVLKLHVNGKEVSGVSECNPRKGYLALESEGSECRFKNIKIKELPSTNPKASEVCDVDKGWKCMFTGLDLAGWKVSDEQKGHWKMNDGVLKFDGNVKGALWSEESFGDFEMVVDYNPGTALHLRGSTIELPPAAKGWSRAIMRVKGDAATMTIDDKAPTNFRLKAGPKTGPLGLANSGAGQFRNLFVRALKDGE